MSSTAFYVLDTSTNTVASVLPPPPILNYLESRSDSAAFSPDGTSLWTLTGCDDGCTTIVGQSFPSGDVFAQTTLATAALMRFDPEPAPAAPPWNVLLGPGESITTTRVFHLPAAASDVGLVLEHVGFNPGVVVLGDDFKSAA